MDKVLGLEVLDQWSIQNPATGLVGGVGSRGSRIQLARGTPADLLQLPCGSGFLEISRE